MMPNNAINGVGGNQQNASWGVPWYPSLPNNAVERTGTKLALCPRRSPRALGS
jgi:hypothetical protein